MQKETKKRIIWSFVAAALIAATVLFSVLGIRAGILKNRSSDFAVDTTGLRVSAVYENNGYYAVGTYDGKVRLYSDADTESPLFTCSLSGASVRDIAIANGRLYVAASNRRVYAFSLTASEDKKPDATYVVGLVPERLHFSPESNRVAVYGVSDSSNRRGLYFLSPSARGDEEFSYTSCIEQESDIAGVTMRGDTVYFSSGQSVMRGEIDSERVITPEEIYGADRSILGIAPKGNGYTAIDSEGTVFSFDSDFVLTGSRKNDTGMLGTVFAAGDVFVCKVRNGGIAGVDSKGILFSVPSSSSSLIVYASPDSFAYLTSDEGEFKYYTLETAQSVQRQKAIFVPFTVTGALLLLVAVYATLSIFETPRTRVNGFFKKLGKTLFKHKFAYISLIPTFLLLAVFYWYPIVSSLFMSLFDYLPGERLEFVGLENFRMVFMNAEFWISFKNTLIFLVTDLLKALLPPILFAEFLLALRSKRTSYAIRVLMFLPGILPGVASMLVWADGIFGSSSSGLLNGLISAIVPSWVSQAWLMNNKTALTALIFMNFPWVGSYLIFFGAISGVDKEIYEAAKLDGCGWLRRMIKIDIPLIVPQIKYVFIQTFIGSVQNYTLILITTGGDYGTNTPALMMYFTTVVQKNYGVASAMGVMLLIFLMVATIINFKMQIGGGSKKKHAAE